MLLSDHLMNPLREELRFTGFPFWISLFAIGLLCIEIAMNIKRKSQRQSSYLMDLGILSTGIEGVREAAFKVLGLFLLFLLVGTTIGLNWAALAFAFTGPLLLLDGRFRIAWGLLSTLVVAAFMVVILDNLLFVIYPQPFLREYFFQIW